MVTASEVHGAQGRQYQRHLLEFYENSQDSGSTSICLAATPMPEPEWQYDTATYDSPAIYDMLYDTYDDLCHVVAAYSLDFLNNDSANIFRKSHGVMLANCVRSKVALDH
ncbi:hypothetical protein TSAR_007973 [Trichomalopsis sarcophagae]|uniref:Uncharacterized protein n=1 Tax=Trichomalopsis sarcophagae TaxID=543379 RepID=A0A232FNT4_9HYME|nr:hypothetical protein TSAR_007973 [Trichomalopsis sarcophagae]